MTHQNLKGLEGSQVSRSPHKHPVAIDPKKIIQIRSHMNFHVNSLRNKEGLFSVAASCEFDDRYHSFEIEMIESCLKFKI